MINLLELSEEVQTLVQNAEDAAYNRGKQDALDTRLKTMHFKDNDVLIITGANLNSQMLQSIRIGLKPYGVTAIINVTEETEIGKLSDLNLALLGLQKVGKPLK